MINLETIIDVSILNDEYHVVYKTNNDLKLVKIFETREDFSLWCLKDSDHFEDGLLRIGYKKYECCNIVKYTSSNSEVVIYTDTGIVSMTTDIINSPYLIDLVCDIVNRLEVE